MHAQVRAMRIFSRITLPFLVAVAVLALPSVGSAEIDLLSNDRLIEATKSDDLASAEALLVRGHNVDVRDQNRRTSLFFASIQGNEDFVDLLLRFKFLRLEQIF